MMQTKVPFLDLKSHHAPMLEEINAAIREVIDSAAFAGGPFVTRFEEDFAALLRFPIMRSASVAAQRRSGLSFWRWARAGR